MWAYRRVIEMHDVDGEGQVGRCKACPPDIGEGISDDHCRNLRKAANALLISIVGGRA
jgi:hypothetical protein